MKTWTGYVGLTWLKRFALGAPIGNLLCYINFRAKGCFGALIPTNPVCAVTIGGRISRLALRIMVKGPGQNL